MIILQATKIWQEYHSLHSKKKYDQDVQPDSHQVFSTNNWYFDEKPNYWGRGILFIYILKITRIKRKLSMEKWKKGRATVLTLP